MKALRLFSLLSVLPLALVVDAWTCLEEWLARGQMRRR
jgi:hypothetical protein